MFHFNVHLFLVIFERGQLVHQRLTLGLCLRQSTFLGRQCNLQLDLCGAHVIAVGSQRHQALLHLVTGLLSCLYRGLDLCQLSLQRGCQDLMLLSHSGTLDQQLLVGRLHAVQLGLQQSTK